MIVVEIMQLTLQVIVTLGVMIMIVGWGWRKARALLCNKTTLIGSKMRLWRESTPFVKSCTGHHHVWYT